MWSRCWQSGPRTADGCNEAIRNFNEHQARQAPSVFSEGGASKQEGQTLVVAPSAVNSVSKADAEVQTDCYLGALPVRTDEQTQTVDEGVIDLRSYL